MLLTNGLSVSLLFLTCLRIFAFIIFLEFLIRKRKLCYSILMSGWLLYAAGSVTGILMLHLTGKMDHPLVGYIIATATFLIITGFLLYFFHFTVKRMFLLLGAYSVVVLLFLIFAPGQSGILSVSAQLLLLLITIALILFKRKRIIETGGIISYIWILFFLLLSLVSVSAHLAFSSMPVALRFTFTFCTNISLIIFFFQYDREQALRRIQKDEERIRVSLREKETLLKEVHHRVKNNLSIMSSLLYLQSTISQDSSAREQIIKAESRIRTMSIVHETLYESETVSSINLRSYIENLISYVKDTLRSDIDLDLNIADCDITPEKLIPCGLIINEALTNACSHAFGNTEHKQISITAGMFHDEMLRMEIRDNGEGLPAGFNPRETEGLGFILMTNLINQLRGEMMIERDGGTLLTFVFPLTDHESSFIGADQKTGE